MCVLCVIKFIRQYQLRVSALVDLNMQIIGIKTGIKSVCTCEIVCVCVFVHVTILAFVVPGFWLSWLDYALSFWQFPWLDLTVLQLWGPSKL